MRWLASLLLAAAGGLFGVIAVLGVLTKLTSIDLRAVVVITAFGIASYACLSTAARVWRGQRVDS